MLLLAVFQCTSETVRDIPCVLFCGLTRRVNLPVVCKNAVDSIGKAQHRGLYPAKTPPDAICISLTNVIAAFRCFFARRSNSPERIPGIRGSLRYFGNAVGYRFLPIFDAVRISLSNLFSRYRSVLCTGRVAPHRIPGINQFTSCFSNIRGPARQPGKEFSNRPEEPSNQTL